MSPRWRMTVIVAAVAGTVSTPLFWLLEGPNTGQLVGATVQAATGVGALIWAWLQPATPPTAVLQDIVVQTGRAEATGGGQAHTGIRRRDTGDNRAARAQQTGEAIAHGRGSTAGTGIDYTG
ncbi:hypothetical protein AV521_07590 [Streptomyces sp. IMTB 2501]|nr:hypothetical protein AV521_07590 [Streptomyces sp. IMTB 2501]